MIGLAVAYFIASGGSEIAPGISTTSSLAIAVPVLVASVTAIPATIAAVGTRDAKRQIAEVRREVMPNGGASSFDLLHRLVWETHERTEPIPDLVVRVERLESHPCPFSPEEDS